MESLTKEYAALQEESVALQTRMKTVATKIKELEIQQQWEAISSDFGDLTRVYEVKIVDHFDHSSYERKTSLKDIISMCSKVERHFGGGCTLKMGRRYGVIFLPEISGEILERFIKGFSKYSIGYTRKTGEFYCLRGIQYGG